MYFDGSKKFKSAGAGVVLISPKGDKLKYVLQMDFPTPSNNEVKVLQENNRIAMGHSSGHDANLPPT